MVSTNPVKPNNAKDMGPQLHVIFEPCSAHSLGPHLHILFANLMEVTGEFECVLLQFVFQNLSSLLNPIYLSLG